MMSRLASAWFSAPVFISDNVLGQLIDSDDDDGKGTHRLQRPKPSGTKHQQP